jgi:hypothetical protein
MSASEAAKASDGATEKRMRCRGKRLEALARQHPMWAGLCKRRAMGARAADGRPEEPLTREEKRELKHNLCRYLLFRKHGRPGSLHRRCRAMRRGCRFGRFARPAWRARFGGPCPGFATPWAAFGGPQWGLPCRAPRFAFGAPFGRFAPRSGAFQGGRFGAGFAGCQPGPYGWAYGPWPPFAYSACGGFGAWPMFWRSCCPRGDCFALRYPRAF